MEQPRPRMAFTGDALLIRSCGRTDYFQIVGGHWNEQQKSEDVWKLKQMDSVTVETCAHYLAFAAEDIPEGATQYKCAPPLREAHYQELLWKALMGGDIDMITIDHSPSTIDLKLLEEGDFLKAWGGISGIQVRLTRLCTQAITIVGLHVS